MRFVRLTKIPTIRVSEEVWSRWSKLLDRDKTKTSRSVKAEMWLRRKLGLPTEDISPVTQGTRIPDGAEVKEDGS